VTQPIIWKEITTAFNGRAIGGSRAVEHRVVRVRTEFGEKAAPLEDADGVWVGDGGGGKGINPGEHMRRPFPLNKKVRNVSQCG